jgi:adenylate cyclase class IV
LPKKPVEKSEKERETVLIVKGNGESFFEKLGKMDTIWKFRLRAGSHKIIRDTYFDSPEHSLLRNEANLRLRESDGQTLVTAKLASKTDRNGVSSRKEIELPWSVDALTTISRKLDLGIPGITKLDVSSRDAPRQQLKKIGLQIIQERETVRDTREIFDEKDGSVVAELALDRVVYHFGNRSIPIFEIEVEAKSDTGSKTLKSVRKQIESLNRDYLASWKHGKFITGRAVEKLLREGKLEDIGDHGLKPSALKKIVQLISSREFKKEFETK